MTRPEPSYGATALDAVDAGLIVLDCNRHIVTWNDWMAAASGVDAARAVGKTMEELFPGPKMSRLANAISQALGFGASSLLTHSLNASLLPLRTRSGQQLLHNIAIRPLGQRPKGGYHTGCNGSPSDGAAVPGQ